MEYHEIGERFEHYGVELEVTDYNEWVDGDVRPPCYMCYLSLYDKICTEPSSQCSPLDRRDLNYVYYKLVEQCKPKDMEQENKTGARKNDRLDDKLRWELLPLEDVEDIVRVYTAGAKKYGPDQWQNLPDGIKRYKAALLRHLVEFDKGNEIDEETGCRHLAQVAWNAIAMLHISKQQKQ